MRTLRLVVMFAAAAAIAHSVFAEEPDTLKPAIRVVVPAGKGGVAAGQAVAVTSVTRAAYGGQQGWYIPEDADIGNNNERLLLLLPNGALLVELTMTLDARPYRLAREELVKQVMEAADGDDNGKATWYIAFTKSPMLRARFGGSLGNEQARKTMFARYDRNRNGLVDPIEVRWLLAQLYGGPSFSVGRGNYGYVPNYGQQIHKLLDRDGDGTLSAAELSAAGDRLKSRDADDNDLVDAAEIGGQSRTGYFRANLGRRRAAPQSPLLWLHAKTDWKKTHQTLVARYGQDKKLPAKDLALLPALADKLDADSNGEISAKELAKLAEAEPQLRLSVNLGESGELISGLTLVSLDPALGDRKQIAGGGKQPIQLALADLTLEIAAPNNAPQYNYANTVKSMFTRFDKDKNGYLELKELDNPQAAYMKRQFDLWDADEDKKVYPKEMEAGYLAMQQPLWTRIVAAAVEKDNALLTLLDQSGDSRLGLREMRNAGARLASLDRNQDGAIDSSEVPREVRLTIARGQNVGRSFAGAQVVFTNGRRGGSATPAAAKGPKWFVHMDRNGDGDVTPREFPGTAEQFSRLDRNADGFIDPDEAEAGKAKPDEKPAKD